MVLTSLITQDNEHCVPTLQPNVYAFHLRVQGVCQDTMAFQKQPQ